MNPATLRHRITIQRKTVTRDDYAQEIESWSDVGTYWAEVKAKTGRPKLDGDTPTTSKAYTITVRYDVGIQLQEKDRVLANGLTLDIDGIADKEGTRKYIEIAAS